MPANLLGLFCTGVPKCHKTGKFPLSLVSTCPVLEKAWPHQHPSPCMGLDACTHVPWWSPFLGARQDAGDSSLQCVLLSDTQVPVSYSPSSAFLSPSPQLCEKSDHPAVRLFWEQQFYSSLFWGFFSKVNSGKRVCTSLLKCDPAL